MLPNEKVIVCCDTLRDIVSATVSATPIFTTPDSFLVGECSSASLGTLRADLITQFACPIDAVYPDSSELDSVCLVVYYRSWYGDGEAPLRLNAHLLDGETLCYDSLYNSDIDLSRFVSEYSRRRSVLIQPQLVSAAHPNNTTVSGYHMVTMRLTDEVAQQLFNARDFSSQQAFQRAFKGLYITTDFGSSTVLYLSNVALICYFHHTYLPTAQSTQYVTLRDSRIFPANSEVRQINRYEYPDVAQIRQQLCQMHDTNFVLTPSNLYTRISIPVAAMRGTIKEHTLLKRPYINMASLVVDVLNYPNSSLDVHYNDWAHPAKTMLLIKESAADRFFRNNELPSDTCAISSTLATEVDTTNTYSNFYTFDLSKMLAQQVRDTAQFVDTLHLLLVPVQIAYSQSSSGASTISGIHVEQTVTATMLRSALTTERPMNIELLYSGFDAEGTWATR